MSAADDLTLFCDDMVLSEMFITDAEGLKNKEIDVSAIAKIFSHTTYVNAVLIAVNMNTFSCLICARLIGMWAPRHDYVRYPESPYGASRDINMMVRVYKSHYIHL
jgi:hypothetical protein